MIYLIIYIIGIPISYYFFRKHVHQRYTYEVYNWGKVFFKLFLSMTWPITIFFPFKRLKVPKWL